MEGGGGAAQAGGRETCILVFGMAVDCHCALRPQRAQRSGSPMHAHTQHGSSLPLPLKAGRSWITGHAALLMAMGCVMQEAWLRAGSGGEHGHGLRHAGSCSAWASRATHMSRQSRRRGRRGRRCPTQWPGLGQGSRSRMSLQQSMGRDSRQGQKQDRGAGECATRFIRGRGRERGVTVAWQALGGAGRYLVSWAGNPMHPASHRHTAQHDEGTNTCR